MEPMQDQDPIPVLVVDDDPMLRTLLVEALGEHGYRVMDLSNPMQAEEAVSLWGAQIVLCDIRMPEMDGIEVTRRLKARDAGTQVILMTAYPTSDTVGEAFHLGADGYLLKPFRSLQEVYDAIDQAAMRLRSWQRTLREAVRREFPDEYAIIYDGAADLPAPPDLDRLVSSVAEDEPVE